MKKTTVKAMIFAVILAATTSCTTVNQSMREPNTLVELTKNDFTLSEQVTAEATSTKIFTLDFERLFTKKMGNINGEFQLPQVGLASIPVIGPVLGAYTIDRTANYALYNLMKNHPGYDVVFYPQYETTVVKPVLGIGFIMKVTTVKTTARLGKLK